MRLFGSKPWGHLGELSEENSHETLNANVEQKGRAKRSRQVKQVLLYVVSRILKAR